MNYCSYLLELEVSPVRKSTGWQSGRSAIAAPIVTAPVGELSVRYDDTLRSWEMMTLDESRKAIVSAWRRSRPAPGGNEIPVATASEYPNRYGGFLHRIPKIAISPSR